MGLKSHLTPLSELDELDEEAMGKLRDASITTVEDLVGALESSPDSMRELLSLDEPAFHELKERAYEVLDPDTRKAIEEQRGKDYSLGAIYPGRKPRGYES